MRTSASDTKEYKAVLQMAVDDENVFKEFKRHPWYTRILEHATKEQGELYYKRIAKNNPWILEYPQIELFIQNDLIGSPVKYKYNDIEISPSSLRYLNVLSDLWDYKLLGRNIVEIGGGYGGQCLIISQIFRYKTYKFYDLDKALLLIQKYLLKHDIVLPKTSVKKYDLVISNYAFTECNSQIQDVYLKKVINKSEHGYITGNFDSKNNIIGAYALDKLLEVIQHNVKIYNENPSTYIGNKILIW